jgi:large subunit ribosomal protein L18
MAKGPTYRVAFRRRREGKTDYGKRLRLLKSGKPRFVVRWSLNHVRVQVVGVSTVGDYVIAQANTKELQKMGWKGGTSNLPAAYLTGLLCAKRALEKGVTECVPDINRYTPTKGARVFAVIKGALDAGLIIPCDPEVMPDDGRTAGEHIAEHARKLKEEDPDLYSKKFSQYLARGLPPEELPKHFNIIKEKILGGVIG